MIVVFGSINADVITQVDHFPAPGETILTSGYETKPGGKGANQAVAAAKAGAEVHMLGALGHDALAEVSRTAFRNSGVDTKLVRTTDSPSGAAMITVDKAGENNIVVASGANMAVKAEWMDNVTLNSSATVVLQMELAAEETFAVARKAHEAGARVILNLAPAAPIPADVFQTLDVFIVNEIEARMVAKELGFETDDPVQLASTLAKTGNMACVMTLGAKGALAADANGSTWQVAALKIEPVDTTGAGDAFVGILAASLDTGRSLPEALRHAAAGSGLACLKLGAQEAQPTAAEIDARLNDIPAPEIRAQTRSEAKNNAHSTRPTAGLN